MARNLQSKLPPSDTLNVYDVNKRATENFVKEVHSQGGSGAAVKVAETAREATENAVSSIQSF